jgi:hypothetical protein
MRFFNFHDFSFIKFIKTSSIEEWLEIIIHHILQNIASPIKELKYQLKLCIKYAIIFKEIPPTKKAIQINE